MQLGLTLYIQMQLCGPNTLRNWLSTRSSCPVSTVDNTTCMRIAEQLIQGISHIHKKGILHRDLKPENIFLDGTESDSTLDVLNVRVGDFGLSKIQSFFNSSGTRGEGYNSIEGSVDSSSSQTPKNTDDETDHTNKATASLALVKRPSYTKSSSSGDSFHTDGVGTQSC